MGEISVMYSAKKGAARVCHVAQVALGNFLSYFSSFLFWQLLYQQPGLASWLLWVNVSNF